MRCYTLPEPTDIERKIAAAVAGRDASSAEWSTFPNGEVFVRVPESSLPAAIVGRTAPPGENFFYTTLLADTLRRTGVKEIVAAIPYMAYARQDRQQTPGDAVTAAFLTAQLAKAGVTRIVTVDVHSMKTKDESPIPVVNVDPVPDLAFALQMVLAKKDFTIVSPDFGARHRAEAFAAALQHEHESAWVEKRRDPETGKVSLVDVNGDLRGNIAVIVDDILDTGGTIELAVKMLREKKFETIFLCETHPVFSGGAAARMRRLGIGKIFTTNTIPLNKDAASLPGVQVVDISARVAAAVRGEES